MNTLTTSNESPSDPPHITKYQSGTWKAALLAGLPHLIMGLLFALGKFSIFDTYDPSEISSQAISMAVGISLGIFIIGLLLFAWRRGWPLWSASWYLHGTWVVMAVASLLIDGLNLEGSWRYTNALFLGWIVVCIIGYFLIVSKSRLHGLLSVAFLFPMLGLMFLEFIPNPIEGWLAIGFGLAAAACAGVIVRRGDFRLSLGLVLSFNIIAGLLLAYISEYQMKDLPAGIPAHIPEFSNFISILGLYSIFGLGVVAIPFILRGLWSFGKGKLAG